MSTNGSIEISNATPWSADIKVQKSIPEISSMNIVGIGIDYRERVGESIKWKGKSDLLVSGRKH